MADPDIAADSIRRWILWAMSEKYQAGSITIFPSDLPDMKAVGEFTLKQPDGRSFRVTVEDVTHETAAESVDRQLS